MTKPQKAIALLREILDHREALEEQNAELRSQVNRLQHKNASLDALNMQITKEKILLVELLGHRRDALRLPEPEPEAVEVLEATAETVT